MALLHTAGIDIMHNVRIKTYPDGSVEVLAASRPIFRESGYEASGWRELPHRGRTASPTPESVKRAMRRARAAVRDIALSTPFTYFVTLTLDAERVDRYDEGNVIRKLNNWLDNQVRRRGLAYIVVPEHHKDGAIHFHGFFNDALPAVDSGHADAAGHAIYNLPSWTLGFTAAIKLYGDYQRAVSYVCKYIGKEGAKIGGRWYYSGGDIKRPTVMLADGEYRDIADEEGAYSFDVPAAQCRFARLMISETS